MRPFRTGIPGHPPAVAIDGGLPGIYVGNGCNERGANQKAILSFFAFS